MTEITVTAMEPEHFGVQVREGDLTTSHRVRVPTAMLEDLDLADVDPEVVVRETIAFLLEREPGTSVDDELDVERIPGSFPEFYDELRARVAS